jgi:hypothetical protein
MVLLQKLKMHCCRRSSFLSNSEVHRFGHVLVIFKLHYRSREGRARLKTRSNKRRMRITRHMARRSFVTVQDRSSTPAASFIGGWKWERRALLVSLAFRSNFPGAHFLTCFPTYFFADYFAYFFLAVLFLGPGQESFDQSVKLINTGFPGG